MSIFTRINYSLRKKSGLRLQPQAITMVSLRSILNSTFYSLSALGKNTYVSLLGKSMNILEISLNNTEQSFFNKTKCAIIDSFLENIYADNNATIEKLAIFFSTRVTH